MDTPNHDPAPPKPTMRRICCVTQAQTTRPRASMADHLRAAAVWAQIFQAGQEIPEQDAKDEGATTPHGIMPDDSTARS
ncbi:hypothetical protein [Candidatus Oscillochloris fontis]|uniref:hypothetical protein n=1 Tax=Candidatus Oscillochloris fontis TaxID=2496868 RepID=UPI00137648C7|nr:hypothetical protein [Candidatus Oscillochloris fontis]